MQIGNPWKNRGSGLSKASRINNIYIYYILPPTPMLHPLPYMIPSFHPFRHRFTIRKSFSLPSAKTKDAATLLRLADLDEDPSLFVFVRLWGDPTVWKPEQGSKFEKKFPKQVQNLNCIFLKWWVRVGWYIIPNCHACRSCMYICIYCMYDICTQRHTMTYIRTRTDHITNWCLNNSARQDGSIGFSEFLVAWMCPRCCIRKQWLVK